MADVSDEILLKVMEAAVMRMATRLEKYGRGASLSNHSSLGELTEEFWEVANATRGDDLNALAEEYFDVAVSALFAVASMMAQNDENLATDENIVKDALQEATEKEQDNIQNRAAKSGLYIVSSMDEV